MANKQLNIGIIGLGTVGSGVIETLEKKIAKHNMSNWPTTF